MAKIESVQRLGQPAMRLVTPDGAEATVLLHGGHLISWIPAGDQERLYLSPQAVAGPGQAVRGGVPVIFPQFNEQGPLPRHGLARDRAWQWTEGDIRGNVAIGVLTLTDDAATRAIWPQAFSLELTLVLSGLELELELAVTNTGETRFDFAAALHSYFRLDDFRRARLKGLFAVHYTDAVNGVEQVQELDPVGFAGEIDRIYRDLESPLTLVSALGHMGLHSQGFPDAVVWNPGPNKAAAMPDLPDDDWLQFICIEAAAVHNRVVLAPGQEWVARQRWSA